MQQESEFFGPFFFSSPAFVVMASFRNGRLMSSNAQPAYLGEYRHSGVVSSARRATLPVNAAGWDELRPVEGVQASEQNTLLACQFPSCNFKAAAKKQITQHVFWKHSPEGFCVKCKTRMKSASFAQHAKLCLAQDPVPLTSVEAHFVTKDGLKERCCGMVNPKSVRVFHQEPVCEHCRALILDFYAAGM